MFDIVIKGARVFHEGRLEARHLGIRGGLIEAISDEALPAREVLDMTGCWVLPGMIDTHVHFREPGRTDKEDFESGTRASVIGGVTTVLEIQNNEPLMTDVARLAEKHATVAGKTYCNYGLYANVGVENLPDLQNLAREAVAFKVFMTQSVGPLTVTGLADLWKAFSAVAETGKVLAVHAESDAICKAAREGLPDHAASHARARPALAEAVAVAEALEIARATGLRLHLAHLSTGRAAELCRTARRQGHELSAATCPHYLWFDEDDVARGGNVWKVNPPIKSRHDRAGLIAALKAGDIDHVHSDHAPHTLAEKGQNYRTAPSGIAAVQHQLLVLLELERRGDLTLSDVVRVSAEAPAIAFDLAHRGRIARGFAADLVVIDPTQGTLVTEASLASRAGSSPWVGTEFSRSIRATIVGGRIAAKDGAALSGLPFGKRIG